MAIIKLKLTKGQIEAIQRGDKELYMTAEQINLVADTIEKIEEEILNK